ncbi:hypothetical protein L218DRAFT_171097 [Marasmius fiardii PR-910]|nr:hypothetical protein L218DRAFT_171097 [Marasmius fiardii PR-910]
MCDTIVSNFRTTTNPPPFSPAAMALDDPPPLKLVVLAYGVKLIRVEVAESIRLPDFLDTILQSDQYNFPSEAYIITRKYQPRHIRYLTPDRPIPIQNLDDIPKQFNPKHLLWINVKVATMYSCMRGKLPADGSCINLIIEEPFSIKDPGLKGARRFYSREIVLFLEEYGIEVSPNNLGNARL